MAGRFALPALSLLSVFSSTVNAALPTISTVGNKFFDANGKQFFIKGVAYQLVPEDPLVDTNQCQQDATLMQSLGTNAIRVYHVNPWANHDGCMAAFDAAGIYTFIDLDTFNTTVVQTAPAWTQGQFEAYAMVMDVFSKYDNMAGFYIGNEVINSVGDPTAAAPYIKASLADLKAYQTKQGYRRIPIGYSHADVAGLRPVLQDYFLCGDSATALDFFSLNCYEWCGSQDYMTSGYATLNNQTIGFPVPIFISETGCNVPEPRTFQDQAAIFGPMAETWSGSIIYEWIQEENHYGLITYGGDNADALNSAPPAGGYSRSGAPTPISPDFSNLMSAWKTVSPSSVQSADYKPTGLITPSCPASTAGVWEVNGDVPLPTIGAANVQAMSYSAAPGTSASVPASITSAAATASASGNSLRSSIQSTNAGSSVASSARAAATSASSSGAAVAGRQVSSVGGGLGSFILGLLMLI